MEPYEIYGVSVSVPAEFLEKLMDGIDSVSEPVYPGYRRCFSYFPAKGTWITQEGSRPYNGEAGKVTVADEIILKFVCRKEDISAVLKKIKEIHPYEEPAIDVVPQIGWKSLIETSL